MKKEKAKPGAIRVLLADDHAVVRQGLRAFFETQSDITVAGEAATGREAVEFCRNHPVDVVLMDMKMPELDGVAATRMICALPRGPRVLVLTSFADDTAVIPALEAGATSYQLKDVGPVELAEAVRRTARGEAMLHPQAAAHMLASLRKPATRAVPADDLTAREIDVLRAMGAGLANGEIALRLHVSESTVKTHVSNILAKLGLADRTQAAIHAWRSGLLSDSPSTE